MTLFISTYLCVFVCVFVRATPTTLRRVAELSHCDYSRSSSNMSLSVSEDLVTGSAAPHSTHCYSTVHPPKLHIVIYPTAGAGPYSPYVWPMRIPHYAGNSMGRTYGP
jgi:hypothetical protein